MPVEDGQLEKLPSPNAGSKSYDASQAWLYPVLSNSNSLEDGEIVEGRFPSVSSQTLSQQSKDRPQHVCSSSPARATTSTFPTPIMTKEDLDRAKSLVLDLLGWGVTPEYLVECGLSPATIYKIFTDLRLRLPTNLDASSRLIPLHHGVG